MPADTLTRPPTVETIPHFTEVSSDVATTHPHEIFGMDPEALKNLSEIAVGSTLFPEEMNKNLRLIPTALRMAPLIESTLLRQEAAPDADAAAAKRKHTVSDLVETLKAGPGKVVLKGIERKLEHGSRNSHTGAAEEDLGMPGTLEKITGVVEAIRKIDNPQEQFVHEVGTLSREVSAAIIQQRDLRAAGRSESLPKQKGFIGFALRVVHKVKGFFKRLLGRPEKPSEITAYDAGAGIEETFRDLKRDPEATAERFPLLSKLVLDYLPVNRLVNREYLSLAAPEILSFLFSAARKEDIDEDLLSSVERKSHPFRVFVKHKKHLGKYSVEAVQRASHTLLPALKDALPTQGAKLSGVLHYLQNLDVDKATPLHDDLPEDNEDNTAVKAPKFKTVKRLLGKLNTRRKS